MKDPRYPYPSRRKKIVIGDGTLSANGTVSVRRLEEEGIKAYKEEKFPKPRNVIGMAKDLPVPKMEKLILTHIVVGDDDLRSPASQRAMQVKDYLLKSGHVEPERIFVVEPESL